MEQLCPHHVFGKISFERRLNLEALERMKAMPAYNSVALPSMSCVQEVPMQSPRQQSFAEAFAKVEPAVPTVLFSPRYGKGSANSPRHHTHFRCAYTLEPRLPPSCPAACACC